MTEDEAMPSVPPIVISFMLACYFSSDPEKNLGVNHWNSEAGKDTRQWLLDEGLIEMNYRASERGKAWIDFICATPLPVQKWVKP